MSIHAIKSSIDMLPLRQSAPIGLLVLAPEYVKILQSLLDLGSNRMNRNNISDNATRYCMCRNGNISTIIPIKTWIACLLYSCLIVSCTATSCENIIYLIFEPVF